MTDGNHPEAWAVIDGGQINVRSVAPTRLGALVNWLCTEREWVAMVSTTAHTIEDAWARLRGEATVERVAVCVAGSPPSEEVAKQIEALHFVAQHGPAASYAPVLKKAAAILERTARERDAMATALDRLLLAPRNELVRAEGYKALGDLRMAGVEIPHSEKADLPPEEGAAP